MLGVGYFFLASVRSCLGYMQETINLLPAPYHLAPSAEPGI